MSEITQVLAFDFGASSGRAILGRFDGQTVTLKEIHRFANDPVMLGDTMYWDVLRLFHEIKQSLIKAKPEGEIASIGVDTWGVDFGLLDKDGRLLENPVHYRDRRTAGMLKEAFQLFNQTEFYQITGNQFMEINTAFQLLSLVKSRSESLERAERMLLMPDLFNYFLCGKAAAEMSIASTTQLLDARRGDWAKEVMAALGIPKRLFAPIVPSGTKLGPLTKALCEELDVAQMDVIAVAGHDTQCAMAAVPTQEDRFAFLSCGTWSLLGTELDAPLINEKSRRYNLTNERGADRKTSFLKNIVGLWLIQESRRQWQREGREYSFGELEQMAVEAGPFGSFIDPDAPEFLPSGDLPGRIRAYCRRTKQKVPQTAGEIVRCIDESLALKYRFALEQLEECTGRRYPVLHMIGGGIQSKLLCRLTAGAIRRNVIAGPVEATVLGNIALQLLASGALETIAQARAMIAKCPDMETFYPEETNELAGQYSRFKELIKC